MLKEVYYDDDKVVDAAVDAYYNPYLMEGGSRAPLALSRVSMDHENGLLKGRISSIQQKTLE